MRETALSVHRIESYEKSLFRQNCTILYEKWYIFWLKIFFFLKWFEVYSNHNRALHTDTETGFTGCRSPIRIWCGLTWAPHGTQTKRIALLDCISCTVPEHCHAAQHAAERPCGGTAVFGSEPRSASDPRVESPNIFLPTERPWVCLCHKCIIGKTGFAFI